MRSREVKRAADDFLRQLERTRRAEQQQSGGGFGGALSSIGGGSLGALSAGGGVAALVGGVTKLATVGISYKETLDKLNKSFETLLGSQEAAARHVKELQDFAARTPFEFEDVARASQRFQNMGLAAKEVIPTLTAVGNAVAAASGGAEQVDRVSLALAQMSAKGKASQEEYNQLAEAGVGALKILEAHTGKTKAELIEMTKAGEISASMFLQAFRQAHGSGNAMQKQMETLSGATSTLTDWTKNLLAQGFTPLHSLLREISVELAKNTTEGFNFARALRAVGAASKDAMEMASPFAGPFAGGALGFPFAQLSMWAEATKPKSKASAATGGGGVNVPDELKYQPRISDADLIANMKRLDEEARVEAARKAEEAERKARAETEKHASAVKGLSDRLRDLTIQNDTFNQSEIEQQIALMRAHSGVELLSGSYRKQAEMIVNLMAVEMRSLDVKQRIKEEEVRLKKEAEEAANGRLRAEAAFIDLLGVEGAELRAIKDLLTDPHVRDALTVQEAKMLAVLATMKDMKSVFRDIPLTANVPVSNIRAPQAAPLDLSKVKVDPWIDFRERLSEIREEMGSAQGQWREGFLNMAEDGALHFENMFMRIGEGWKAMLGGLALDFAQSLQQMAAQALASQVWGMVLNLAGSALGSFLGPKLPMAGASKMNGSYLQPSAFAGGFAEGGYIPPGKWGMTGERGPEPVFGGRTGATVIPNSKADQTVINKTTIINYQPRNVPNSVTSRRSNRETFEALLASVR